MTEDELRKQIEPIPDHDYFYFVSADWSLGVNATCRAYINFSNTADIFIFRDKFDGYVFVDGRGNEYPAIVEFAPFQNLQKGKARKKDSKANSIETEPHYLAFLETLQVDESDPKAELKMEYSFRIKDGERNWLVHAKFSNCILLTCFHFAQYDRPKDYVDTVARIFGECATRATGRTEA